MKPNRSNPLFARLLGAGLSSLIALSCSASAADVVKDNNANALNLTSSWVGGTSAATSADVAVWNSTVTTANSPALGADLTWLGLKVTNPGGLVTVGADANTLTLGTSGIDLSAATQDIYLNGAATNVGASNQDWNIASGRSLRLGNGNLDGVLNGSGTITVKGGGLVDLNPTTVGADGFSGKWIVETGATLRTARHSQSGDFDALGTNVSADAVTLKGGTLAVGGFTGSGAQGDWTWANPITLGTSTSSKISGQNPDAAAHTLTISGAISGTGNLTFEKTQGGAQTYVLRNIGTAAGARTNVMGTGSVTANGVTLQPQVSPGTANVITHNNNLKLINATLLSDDAQQTFAGTISLEGSNNFGTRWNDKPVTITGNIVDGSVSGAVNFNSNTVNINGSNSYTGVTTISAGTVNINGVQNTTGASNLTGGTITVFSSKGFGTGLVTMDTAAVTVSPTTAGITSTISSIRQGRDLILGNNVLMDITSGSIQMRQTNGFWIKGTGTVGRLTSSSGALALASTDAAWVTSTGALSTADHQIQIPIVDFNGSTPVSLTKSGVNQLSLNGANTYSGGTTINGGRLQIGNATGLGTGQATVTSGGQAYLTVAAASYANNFSIAGTGPLEGTDNFGALRFGNNAITGNVAIVSGGARIGITANNTGTISGALSGSGALEINSTSATAPTGTTLILSGNNSGYTGAATLSKGSLTISDSFGGSITKVAGTTLANNGTVNSAHTHTTGILQGTGTFVGGLTLNGSTTADVLNVVPGALHVTGNVTLSGTTTVRASGLGGAVPVLYYTGTLTGGAANLSLENASSFRGAAIFDTSVPGVITLNIQGAAITWSGATNTNWNTTSSNWTNAGNPDTYFQSDSVTFGDTGAGTVNLVGTLSPGSITINNSLGNNYTFTGATGTDVISGTTGITKSGAGSLTLSSSNSFLGAVTLSGGTTTFSARQVYTGNTSITNGAVLDLTNGGGQTGTIRGTVNLSGAGSTLRLSAADATGYSSASDRISVMNISNGGTLEINNAGANETFSNVTINLTGGNIIKGANGYNGNVDIFNGTTSINSLASSDTSLIASGVNLGLRQTSTTFNTELGTTASGIDLQIDGSINCSSQTFTNPNLVKSGAGTLCLNNTAGSVGGTTIYTGTTTINGGKLIIGTGGSSGIIGTGAIIDNAALVFNRSDALTLSNAITGTGTLEQRGSGSLTLTAGGSRSGVTSVTAGSLYTGTAAFTASTFRADSGGTLSGGTPAAIGTGTVAGLDLNGGSAVYRVSSASSDKLVVTATNGFTVSSATQISCTPSGSFQTGDVIPLIDYSGSIGGLGFAGLSLAAGGNPHISFALVNNTTDTRVDALVTADTLIWKGSTDNNWDTTTENWETLSTSTATVFYEFDKVKFTDAGAANTTVLLNGAMSPNSVEFDATIPYTLDGSAITGAASVVKKNTNTVTLINENSYTGTTTINTGTLQIGDGNTWGSLGATAVTNNATLAYNRSGAFTVATTIDGSGQIVKRGSGQMTFSGNGAFTGPVVVETGTLIVGTATSLGTTASGVQVNPGATLSTNGLAMPTGETISIAGTGVAGFALTGDGTLLGNLVLTGNATIGSAAGRWDLGVSTAPITISGAYTLTKDGGDAMWYRGPTNGTGNSLAALVVNGGVFGIETNDNGLSGVPVTVNAGGTLSSWANIDGSLPTTQNNPVTLNGGVLASDYAGQSWTGPVTLTANSTLGAANSAQNFTISGVISQSAGSFGFTKTQASIVTLTAVNTYTGTTTVNAGTLNLADNAGLKFVIGANGVSNKVTGAGAATLDGDFTLDLTGAALANGNSWTLVDTATKTFGATFTVAGFTRSGVVHTRVVGNQTWTFSETTGALTLAIAAAGYDSWLANYGALPVDQRDAEDDYDADGLNNLLEYVLGGSPLVSDAAAIAPATSRSGGNLVVTFKRSDLSEADTTQVLQYGTDLGSWSNVPIGASPGAGMVAISEDNPTADLDTVTVTIPTSGATEFFVRLKVTKP